MRRIDYEIDNSRDEARGAPRTKAASGEPLGGALALRKGTVGWVIDHLPTGYALARFDTVPKAKVHKFARAVLAAHRDDLAALRDVTLRDVADAERGVRIAEAMREAGASLGLRRDGFGFWCPSKVRR